VSGLSHHGQISDAGGVAGVAVVKRECALVNTVQRRSPTWARPLSDVPDGAAALGGSGMATQVFHLIEQPSR
jgi:hypothetical protein